jgi:conjugative transfer pilus assembly protein TraH
MQNLNNLAKNSCQMAHMIIDPAEKSISNAVNGDGSVGASQKGMFSDAMGSLTGYLADANSYFKKQGEVNPKSGNRVMKAILASGATNILGLTGLGNQDGSSDDASNPNSLNNKILISFLGYEIDGVPCTTSMKMAHKIQARLRATTTWAESLVRAQLPLRLIRS